MLLKREKRQRLIIRELIYREKLSEIKNNKLSLKKVQPRRVILQKQSLIFQTKKPNVKNISRYANEIQIEFSMKGYY